MIEGIPLPATDDPADAPFWQATLRGELAIQRCSQCRSWRFPPRPMCPNCQSFEHAWEPTAGRGKIWSVAIPHPPLLPAFAALAPYNVIIVELDEDPQLRLIGNLLESADGALNGIDPRSIEIGTPVRVVFTRAADDVMLPNWVIER